MLENKPSKSQHNIKSKRLTAEEWESHCHAWEKTSLSKAEYCRNHELAKDSFYYRCQRIAKSKPSRTTSDFVPIVQKGSGSTEKITVTVKFPNLVCLTIMISENKLLDLIKALGNATSIVR